jgi:putative transposase
MDFALAIIAGGRTSEEVCDLAGEARSDVEARFARPDNRQDGRSAREVDAAA